jgi:hypothetical protein
VPDLCRPLIIPLHFTLVLGCFDLGDPPVTVVAGRLNVAEGVVFVEQGPVHEGVFERATLIGDDGRFSVPVPTDGTHGFHAYAEGYIYLPIEIEVGRGLPTLVTQPMVQWEYLCDVSGRCDWVEQSGDATLLTLAVDEDPSDNPVISNPRAVRRGAGTFEVSLDVFDPDGDLSNQILAHHIGSGVGVELNPPGPIVDGNRPNGTYTRLVFLPEDAPDDGPWQFVAADHLCSNSDILEVLPE